MHLSKSTKKRILSSMMMTIAFGKRLISSRQIAKQQSKGGLHFQWSYNDAVKGNTRYFKSNHQQNQTTYIGKNVQTNT